MLNTTGLQEVCPNFHAYRVRFGGINFFLVDLVDDVARSAYYIVLRTQYNRTKLHDFFEFADIFFEEEDDDG